MKTAKNYFFFKSINCHTFSEPQGRSDLNDDDDNDDGDDDDINDDNKEVDDDDKKLNKCEYHTTQKTLFYTHI